MGVIWDAESIGHGPSFKYPHYDILRPITTKFTKDFGLFSLGLHLAKQLSSLRHFTSFYDILRPSTTNFTTADSMS